MILFGSNHSGGGGNGGGDDANDECCDVNDDDDDVVYDDEVGNASGESMKRQFQPTATRASAAIATRRRALFIIVPDEQNRTKHSIPGA